MKLLQVIASMDPATGGTSQGVRNTNNELLKLGVKIEVVCMDDPSATFLGQDNFPVYALGPASTAWQYSNNLIPWLLNNILRFDVVIVNGLWLYHGYAVTKTITRLKKMIASRNEKYIIPKLFVMAHGMLDPYFQQAKGRQLKAIRNNLYWWFIESKLINSCNGVLFTCETELKLARESFHPYRPKREINVSYGTFSPPLYNIDMRDDFINKCNGVKSGTPYLLFISRIDEKKGVDLLIQAYINILNRQPPNVEIPKLVIAGPGLDTQHGQQIFNLAAAYSNDILFTGMLTGNSKWGAFYGCQAFILPSHQENFGIAVVEALACGKPALISNQVNIWPEVKFEGCGLVAEDTLKGTEDLIESWINMPYDDKIEMGMYARFCFEKNFDISKTSIKFLEAVSNQF